METKALPVIKDVLDLEGRLYSETDEDSFIGRSADLYFRPKSFERSGKIYEALGVKQFKKFVMGTIGRISKKVREDKTTGTYFIGKERNRKTIKQYEITARINELVHAPATAYFGYKLAEDLGCGNNSGAVGDVIWLLVNGYCTMLQRYNRARVYNTLDALDRREKMLALSDNLSKSAFE